MGGPVTSEPDDRELVSFAPEPVFRSQIEWRFRQLKAELEAMLPNAEVNHVGSTAVPGSLTKGDLDVQLRVEAARFREAKARLGEVFTVNEGGFTGDDGVSFEDQRAMPSAGIHLTIIGGSCDVQTRFRDLLLESEPLRRQYDSLKRSHQGGSMDAYRTAKAEFVAWALAESGSG